MLTTLSIVSLLVMFAAADSPSARMDVAAWRDRQEKKMRGEHSPFAVERVDPLEHDRNTIGSASDAAVKLTGEGIPANAGDIVIRNGKAILVSRSPQLTFNGKFEKEHEIGGSDWIALGSFRVQIRRPNGGFAVRISNLKGQAMLRYHGLKYYAEDAHYR